MPALEKKRIVGAGLAGERVPSRIADRICLGLDDSPRQSSARQIMDERFSDQTASKLDRIDWQFRAAQAPEAWCRIWSLGSDHGLESDE